MAGDEKKPTKRGPKPERLKIEEDPETALQKLFEPKPKREPDPDAEEADEDGDKAADE